MSYFADRINPQSSTDNTPHFEDKRPPKSDGVRLTNEYRENGQGLSIQCAMIKFYEGAREPIVKQHNEENLSFRKCVRQNGLTSECILIEEMMNKSASTINWIDSEIKKEQKKCDILSKYHSDL